MKEGLQLIVTDVKRLSLFLKKLKASLRRLPRAKSKP